MATPKQEKLLKLLIENYGEVGSTKSLGQLLKEAGYSDASAHNPKIILESKEIQEGLNDVIADLEELRRDALKALKEKDLSEERYSDIVKGIDTLTKNHQLLTGGETERNNAPVLVKFIKDGAEGDTNSG